MQALDLLNELCICELNFVHNYVAPASDYPMHNRGRHHHGFLFTVSGTETYHFADGEIDAVPGSVLYIPKGEEYRITLSGEQSVVVTVDFELIGEAARPFVVKFPESASIKSHFMRAESEWNRKSAAYMAECKSRFYRIASLMSKQMNTFLPSEKFDKIARGVEYLHENYLKNEFRLEDVASVCGVSYRYFERLFGQRFGVTPKEYIISLKIERAKELLLSEKNAWGRSAR